jgi:hypothetical protein
MRKSPGRAAVLVVSSLLACTTLLLTAAEPARTQDPPNKGKDIGASPVDLDSNHLLYPGAMRAFIATGSDSPNCLVTLAEATDPWIIGPVFCGRRTFEGRKGVLVSVLFPGQDAGADLRVGLTVYQERARYYGAPVLYPGD